MVTFKPRASRIEAKDAAAMPFPKEETTPARHKNIIRCHFICLCDEKLGWK